MLFINKNKKYKELILKAKQYFQEDDLKESVKYFEEAFKIKALLADYIMYGYILIDLFEYNKAEILFNNMLEKIFVSVVITSLIGTLLSIVLLLLKPITRKTFSAYCNYYIRVRVLAVMIIPLRVTLPEKNHKIPVEITMAVQTQQSENTEDVQIPFDAEMQTTNTDTDVTVNQDTLVKSRTTDALEQIIPVASVIWLIFASAIFALKLVRYLLFIRQQKSNMNYTKKDNKIIVNGLQDFNVEQTLNCGQIFRYQINGNVAKVFSKDKMATLITEDNSIIIETEDIDYFEHFFDLKRDYNAIKHTLSKDEFLLPSIKFGYGIRILNQDLFEMIVSFIISANNNIKRIKNSLNYLSKKFGTKKTARNIKASTNSLISAQGNQGAEYYAFPTLEQLKTATVEDFVQAGLGYRAQYMHDTIQHLSVQKIDEILLMDASKQLEILLSLKGIGEKVAHCIMLFALHQTSVFPVDTWINKVYNDLTKTNSTNRKAISKELTNKYKDLSGYAQQYFFYYYRSGKEAK